jgi:hypothetical protein
MIKTSIALRKDIPMAWGKVVYNEEFIERIGDMNVVYEGTKIVRIGTYVVHYYADKPRVIERIGSMPVKYSVSRPGQIEKIGDMTVVYTGTKMDFVG